MESNLDLVDRYGLPLVILGLIAMGIWRVWRFVRPLLRETLQEHILLIKGLRDGTAANTALLQRQSQALSAHAEALTLNVEFLRKICDRLFTKRNPSFSSGKPRLLVVEDSPTDYLLLRKQLSPLVAELEIEIVHAASLAEAAQMIDAADAVVLDLLLPDAADTMANQVFTELAQLPVVIHTASHDRDADELAAAIAAQIVRKGEPAEVLQAAVRKVLNGSLVG